MTEENKQCCECKEKALKILKEVLTIAAGVFIGAYLAILLGANTLRPKHICPPMGMHHPRPPYASQFDAPNPAFRHHRMRGNYRGEFNSPRKDLHNPRFRKEFNRPERLKNINRLNPPSVSEDKK